MNVRHKISRQFYFKMIIKKKKNIHHLFLRLRHFCFNSFFLNPFYNYFDNDMELQYQISLFRNGTFRDFQCFEMGCPAFGEKMLKKTILLIFIQKQLHIITIQLYKSQKSGVRGDEKAVKLSKSLRSKVQSAIVALLYSIQV